MKLQYKQIYEKIKTGSVSLRRRFVLYVTSAIVTSVVLLLLLLSLFGVLNPVNSRIDAHLDDQLDNHVVQMERDVDKLAAYSLSFSEQMEAVIEDYLTEHDLSFGDLTNDIDALTALQVKAFGTVYTCLHFVLPSAVKVDVVISCNLRGATKQSDLCVYGAFGVEVGKLNVDSVIAGRIKGVIYCRV